MIEAESKFSRVCVGCDRTLLLDWAICPFCITPKQTAPSTCDNCSRQVSTSWAACAWCGVNLGNGPLAASISARREEPLELPGEENEALIPQDEVEEESYEDDDFDSPNDAREVPTSLARDTDSIGEDEESAGEPLPPEQDLERRYRSPFDGDDSLYTRQELEQMYERARTYLPLKSRDVDANIDFLETMVLIDNFSLLHARNQMARFTGERSAMFYQEDGTMKGMGWTQEAILRFFGMHGYHVEDGHVVYKETLPVALEARGYEDLEAYLQEPANAEDGDTPGEPEEDLEVPGRRYNSPFEGEPDVTYSEEELRDLLEVRPRWPLADNVTAHAYKRFLEHYVLDGYSWQTCDDWMQRFTGSAYADVIDTPGGRKELRWSRERILEFFESHGYFVEDGEVIYKPRLTILEQTGYSDVDDYIADWNNWRDDAITDWNP